MVAPDQSVAAIEKLIGQTIPWMGGEPHASVDERPATADAPRKDNGHRQHGRRRDTGRGSQPRGEEGAPAPVARLDEARPRRIQKPAPEAASKADYADEGSGGHLPAFLLRPVRVKA